MRTLVLTHFVQRYDDPRRFSDDAAAVFGRDVVVASDVQTVPVPPRVEQAGGVPGERSPAPPG